MKREKKRIKLDWYFTVEQNQHGLRYMKLVQEGDSKYADFNSRRRIENKSFLCDEERK